MGNTYLSGLLVSKNIPQPEEVIYSHRISSRKPRFARVSINLLRRSRYYISAGIIIGLLVGPLFTGLASSPIVNAAITDTVTVTQPVAADTNTPTTVAPAKPAPTKVPTLTQPVKTVNSKVPAATVTTSAESYYLQAVNNLRASKSLAALKLDNRLSTSAAKKTNDMIAQNYWGHYAPNSGPSFSDYIWAQSPNATKVGENLARCYPTRDAAFDALVKSPTHYAIMVGEFTNFGISEATNPSNNCVYATMHFSLYK